METDSQAPFPMLNMTIYIPSVIACVTGYQCRMTTQSLQSPTSLSLWCSYMMKPHQCVGIRILAVHIFKTSIHSQKHACAAWLGDGSRRPVFNHTLTAGTGVSGQFGSSIFKYYLHSAPRNSVRSITDLHRLGTGNVGVSVLQLHLQRQRLRTSAHQFRGLEKISMVLWLRNVEPKVRLDPVWWSRHELDGGSRGGREGDDRESLHLVKQAENSRECGLGASDYNTNKVGMHGGALI
jgi:hypothetical protein